MNIKSYAFRLLAKKDYFKEELKRKLLKSGFEANQIEELLDYLEEEGYINDEKLANLYKEIYIEKGYSPLKIKNKFFQKGYNFQEKISYEEEFQSALNCLKKYKKEKSFKSIVKYLVNRGFSYEVAKDASNIFLNED